MASVIWGRTGLLGDATKSKNRLRDAQANALEIENERAARPDLIIGGEYLRGNDMEGINAATRGLRDREAYAQAYMKMRAENGSPTLDAAALSPSKVGNAGSTRLGGVRTPPAMVQQQPGAAPPLQGAQNVTNPLLTAQTPQDYADSLYEDVMGSPGGTTPQFETVAPGPTKQKPVIDDGSPVGGRQRRGRMGGTSLLSDEFDDGFRNGGAVSKQKRMKQPGYKSGGKVQMPPGYKWGAEPVPAPMPEPAAQPAARGGYKWGDMPPAPAPRPEPVMGDPTQPPGAAAGTSAYAPVLRRFNEVVGQMNNYTDPMYGYQSGGEVVPGYCSGGKARKRGMRGYAMGGPIGDEMEDDGKDTVDVRVREGEYLLNPPTVAAFGGGDYDAGVEVLNGISTAVNGEEPGPVPVNEEGEAMRGYANGGDVKMGFQIGGFVDDFGNFIDPRQWNAAQQAYATTPEGQVALRGNARGATWEATQAAQARQAAQAAAQAHQGPPLPRGMRWERGAQALRQELQPKIDTAVRKTKAFGKAASLPVVGGAVEAGRQLSDPVKNQYYNDPNVPEWKKGLQAGSDVVDSALRYGGGVFGGALGAGAGLGTPGSIVLGGLGAVGGYMGGDALWEGDNADLRQYREENPVVASGKETAAPAAPQYYRPFGEGRVSLRNPDTLYAANRAVPEGQARIVQRTGGPGDEVIVREDVNGVPTFSNLRTTPQAGDAATLQAQANQRAAEDAARESQQLARQRERMISSDPQLAAQVETARAKNSGGGASTKLADERIRQRFLMPQTDEDGNVTGYVNDEQKVRAFDDAMTLLGVDLEGMSRAQQNEIFENFDSVYRDTMIAMREARARGLPMSDIPRTGANSLRVVPGREILLGDVFGDDATFGDWWAGLGNDDPVLNSYINDPLSGANIPARRVVGDGGLQLDDLIRYGLLKGEK